MDTSLGKNGNAQRIRTKRRLRKSAILNALRENGPMSYSEIAVHTGFSLPIISRLANDLEKEGFVDITPADYSTGGRPPVIVELKPRAKFFLGVDMGRTCTRFVLLELTQSLVDERESHILLVRHDRSILQRLGEEIEALLRETQIAREQLLGVGVAIPGLVDSESGRSESYMNFGEETVAEILEDIVKVPVRVENDARAMALGEKWFGLAKQKRDVLCLNIGYGVGLGIIARGRVYYGASSFAGEFGHIIVEEDGKLCQCGKRGCLETVASGTAIGLAAREALAHQALSKMGELVDDPERIRAETVAKAALQGDQLAIEILERAGTYLGKGLAILINLFNPELIILNGKVTMAGDYFLGPIRTAALKFSLPHIARNVQIVLSELGSKAGAMGAATLIKRDIFETSHIDLRPYV